jgi:pyruvate, orthophosphate dikinase
MEQIPDEWGTAVNVQAMVFGNMGENSGTGVAFTRDAGTGEDIFNGEYLINAQGEDVVAGIRTPQEVTLEGSKDGLLCRELAKKKELQNILHWKKQCLKCSVS